MRNDSGGSVRESRAGQARVKAMILAAGEAKRLRPLTEKVPKPMLEIGGKPVLEHNVTLLAHYGFTEIVVNLHHCPDVVTTYFGDGSAWGVSLSYSYEPALLGTAGAVRQVQDFFDDTFVLLYGDNLSNCDLRALRSRHLQAGAVMTVALFQRDDVSQSGVARLDSHDRILEFIEKPTARVAPSHWVNSGIMVMEPEVVDYIPADRPSDFGFEVLPSLLTSGLRVMGYRMNEDLWWIDTLDSYHLVRALAEEGRMDIP